MVPGLDGALTVLPPFIIEQIRKREEGERRREQPRLELPVAPPPQRSEDAEDDEPNRGVLIIDLG